MPRHIKSGIFIHYYADDDLNKDDKVHEPHRDTHVLFNFAIAGTGRFMIDFNMHHLTAPVLTMTFPGQVHYVDSCKQVTGWSIAFDPLLVPAALMQLLEQIFKGPIRIERQACLYDQLVRILKLLQEFCEGATTAEQKAGLQGLLISMLHWLAGSMRVRCADIKRTNDRAKNIELAFKSLLQEHFTNHKKPSFYSEQLSISTAHLGDTIKAMTGKSVTTHIQEISLLEAKRLLFKTDLSVKEICFMVGYDDPVHFGKLFKRYCGLTPLEFRKKIRE